MGGVRGINLYVCALTLTEATHFWWRCACGRHPYPYRTRRLRRRRPMVLCRGRHGRAGGCQIKKRSNREEGEILQRGLSSAGRAPALQAGGREFESLSLHDRSVQTEKKHLSALAEKQRLLFLQQHENALRHFTDMVSCLWILQTTGRNREADVP